MSGTSRSQASKDINEEQKNGHDTLLENIIKGLQSSVHEEIKTACGLLRELFDKKDHSIDVLKRMARGFERLAELLESNNAAIQLEVVTTISTISYQATQQTQYYVKNNFIKPLLNLLTSSEMEICKQTIHALGIIATYGPESRDSLIMEGIVQRITQIISPDINNLYLGCIALTILLLLCPDENSPPSLEHIKPLFPKLSNLLNHEDSKVVETACGLLLVLTNAIMDSIQEVIDVGAVPRLVALLESDDSSILLSVLIVIYKIVAGTDHQIQGVLNSDVLIPLGKLLSHDDNDIIKTCVEIIAIIAARNEQHNQALLKANIIAPLIKVLQRNNHACKIQAAVVIFNYTKGGTGEEIKCLVEECVIPVICNLLNINDPTIIVNLLMAVYNILVVASCNGEGAYVKALIEKYGGKQSIEILKRHEIKDISDIASRIMNYFLVQENDQEKNNNGNTVQF